MRYLVVLLITTFLFATPATKEDIKEIKQDIKLLIQKVDDLDKKVYANTLKIDMLEKNMNQRFEMMNESFNKRFEAVDKRFEMLTNFMMALTAGIFGLIGFMMWDRRTVVEKAKREMENSESFNKKANKDYVDSLIKAMNELLAKDEMAKEVFRKYGLV